MSMRLIYHRFGPFSLEFVKSLRLVLLCKRPSCQSDQRSDEVCRSPIPSLSIVSAIEKRKGMYVEKLLLNRVTILPRKEGWPMVKLNTAPMREADAPIQAPIKTPMQMFRVINDFSNGRRRLLPLYSTPWFRNFVISTAVGEAMIPNRSIDGTKFHRCHFLEVRIRTKSRTRIVAGSYRFSNVYGRVRG